MSIQQTTHEQNTPKEKRKRIYALQDAASDILGDHPVASCLKQTIEGAAGVAVVKTGGKVRYHNLVTCQHPWICPICKNRIAAVRRDEIVKILKAAHDEGMGDPLFLTMTIEHHAGQPLEKLLKAMLAAWRSVFSGDRSGERQCLSSVAGQIKAVEVRFGTSHWHPHLHVIALVNHAGMTPDKAALLDEQIASVIYSRYSKAVARRGMVAEKAGFYWTPVDDLDKGGWYLQKTVEFELTNGENKNGHSSYSMWQLLEMYDKNPNMVVFGRSVASIFKEYAAATRKRRQISFSRELRKLHTIQNDEDIHEAPESESEESETLVVIGGGLWSYICRQHLRARVLEVAEQATLDGLNIYLEELWVAYDTKRHKQNNSSA